MKLSEKSRIAVVELQKPTHSLFRFLQSIGKDIQYSIRDYGSELDFSEEGIAGIIQDYTNSETTEYRIIRERNVIGLFQKKIIANIDIELNGEACSIECHTWNDFGSEIRRSQTDLKQWKRKYSVVLSNGAQEVKFQMGYIAKYVMISIRGETGYRVRKFSLTSEEQYQHVYLSPPVNTTPHTFSYSLGGLFGMSTYLIAPRVTPIPIGLPDNKRRSYICTILLDE